MRRFVVLAVVSSVVAGFFLAPAVAVADTGGVTCAGTQTVTYSPGIVLQPSVQTIHFSHVLAPCSSTTVPGLTAGFSEGTATRSASCLDLLESDSAVLTFHWNTGESSVFTYDRTVTTVGGSTVVTLTGSVTAGLFAGAAAVMVVIGPAVNLLACLYAPGLAGRSGVVALEIT
ncbi:hypothetical protein [Actinosynnema sp. NPDC020468]|uniref:hypothetical protein n=1 Tax=Actinosynnema sp. NPDC020468 TaxID=3154488 RepID=UPI0033EC3A77